MIFFICHDHNLLLWYYAAWESYSSGILCGLYNLHSKQMYEKNIEFDEFIYEKKYSFQSILFFEELIIQDFKTFLISE